MDAVVSKGREVTPTARKDNLENLLNKSALLESFRPQAREQAAFRVGDTEILITGTSEGGKVGAESRRYMVNIFQPGVGRSDFLVDTLGNIVHSSDNGISPSTQQFDRLVGGLSPNQRVSLGKCPTITTELIEKLEKGIRGA